MNSRKTLFLGFLVVLLGGLVVWDHFKGTPTDVAEGRRKRLIDIDAPAVIQIELVRSNQTIVLDKLGDKWLIRRPFAVRADFAAVSEMLDQFEFAERLRTLTEKDLQAVTLQDFGLDPARAKVTLQTKTGSVTFRIGNETPSKDALYVQVGGPKRIDIVPKSLYEKASQGLDALRDRTAMDFTSSAVTNLQIKSGDRVIELSKVAATTNSEPRWIVSRPLTARADQAKVSELLSDLSGLRIVDFVSEDSKDVHAYQLAEPDREVMVTAGDGGQTLLIGRSPTNDASKVYAKLKNADSIFTIPTVAAKKFAVQINDLRDSRVLVFDPADVQSLEIAHGTDKIAAQLDDKTWKVTLPVAVPADAEAMNRLLHELLQVRVKQFAADVATDLDQYGLAVPAAVVTLRGTGTNLLAQLLIGSVNTPNGVRFVKRSDEPFIYAVATNVVDQLPASYADLRSRQIFDLKPEQITRLTAGDVTLARGDQGRWNLVAPSQGVLDVDAVHALIAALVDLKAESFGRPRTEQDAATGYSIKLSVGPATQWLAVAPDGHAAASTVELTFKLPAPYVETLTQKLLTTIKPAVTNAVPAANP